MEADITYFEARKDSIAKQAIRDMDTVVPFQPLMELPPMIMEQTVPRDATPLNVNVPNIAHFYVDILLK